jgi:hypothetical protein
MGKRKECELMSVTPNYNWPLIEPTDFVTNLPADFEIFGDAVDTTLEAIETKLDVITTEGDLIVGDATGDPVRVPVGTAGQVLASDGDTVEWITPAAGGWEQLATGSITGASVSLTGISQAYKQLVLRLLDYSVSGSTIDVGIQIDGVTSGYSTTAMATNVTTLSRVVRNYIWTNTAAYTTTTNQTAQFLFDNYTTSSSEKLITFIAVDDVTARAISGIAFAPTKNAITQIDIVNNGGGTFDDGTYILFGVK